VAELICWGLVALALTLAIFAWLVGFVVWLARKIIKGD
jgi:hypothetical protein